MWCYEVIPNMQHVLGLLIHLWFINLQIAFDLHCLVLASTMSHSLWIWKCNSGPKQQSLDIWIGGDMFTTNTAPLWIKALISSLSARVSSSSMVLESDISKGTFDFWWMIWKCWSQQSSLWSHVSSTECLIRLDNVYVFVLYLMLLMLKPTKVISKRGASQFMICLFHFFKNIFMNLCFNSSSNLFGLLTCFKFLSRHCQNYICKSFLWKKKRKK